MTSINQNFEIYAGSNKTLEIDVKQESPDGPDLDLSSLTSAQWALLDAKSYQAMLIKTLGSGVEVKIPASDGIVEVIFVPGDTIDLAGDFTHQLRLVDANNNSTVVTVGTFTIQRAA